ncbi:metallophosphatase family protein [Desulfosarcina sp. OttesenSCG-928-A07]|nr:metallophosphatase family protein [Desulfosarcina sp. OttesenSCG-928-A07]
MTTDQGFRVGIVSDTHGLVRPEVLAALSGCGQILHAGDVGDAAVLRRLEEIAPVTAVRGNTDHGALAALLPMSEMVSIENVFFYILHELSGLDLDPVAAGIQVVVSGHTHQPEMVRKNGVIYLNPGSAGYRRHHYPVSIAVAQIENSIITPHLVEISC